MRPTPAAVDAWMTVPRVARLVRAARAYAGITIPELADRLGLGVATIKRIEAGERAPKQLELWAIAKACDLPDEWFDSELRTSVGKATSRTQRFEERVDLRLQRIEAALGMSQNGD